MNAQQINLYQTAFRPVRTPLSGKGVVRWSQVGLMCVLAFIGQRGWEAYSQRQVLARTQAQVRWAQMEVESAKKKVSEQRGDPRLLQRVADLESLLAYQNKVRDLIAQDQIRPHVVGYSAQFISLARQHIDGLWLTEIIIAQSGQQLLIKGMALRPELVTAYLQRLSAEPSLQGLKFQLFQLEQPPEKEPDADHPAPVFSWPVGSIQFMVATDVQDRIVSQP